MTEPDRAEETPLLVSGDEPLHPTPFKEPESSLLDQSALIISAVRRYLLTLDHVCLNLQIAGRTFGELNFFGAQFFIVLNFAGLRCDNVVLYPFQQPGVALLVRIPSATATFRYRVLCIRYCWRFRPLQNGNFD